MTMELQWHGLRRMLDYIAEVIQIVNLGFPANVALNTIGTMYVEQYELVCINFY